MDNFYTILLYVGALLLIGLVKSIGKAGKKKQALANRPFYAVEEKKEEDSVDFNSIFSFLQESSVLPKNETIPPKTKQQPPVIPLYNEGDRSTKDIVEKPVISVKKEGTFVLDDFDLPTAIVYSEILKRPDY